MIAAEWSKNLNRKTDILHRPPIMFWAERVYPKVKTGDGKLKCPLREKVATECFIAPNGNWYACCLDSLQRIVLGNVKETSINEVFVNEKRKQFVKLLDKGKFTEIGYPCSAVASCQYPKEPLYKRAKEVLSFYQLTT